MMIVAERIGTVNVGAPTYYHRRPPALADADLLAKNLAGAISTLRKNRVDRSLLRQLQTLRGQLVMEGIRAATT